MNIDNGICVVPGSHLTGIYPSYPEEFNDYNAIDLESGDNTFDSRIHHSTKSKNRMEIIHGQYWVLIDHGG